MTLVLSFNIIFHTLERGDTMNTITLITPATGKKVKNLSICDYLLLYLDDNNKMKRAIPDFNEQYISGEESLINEALNAEKIAMFKIVRFKKNDYVSSPIFCVTTNELGEIVEYNGYDNDAKLDRFLFDSEKRKRAFKLLNKRR